MARAVVVEWRARARVAALLEREGFEIDVVADDADVAVKMVEHGPADVIVVELAGVMPEALDVCERLGENFAIPTVVLCEAATESEILTGYAVGAAAILIEPIGSHELVARVRALLRRSRAPQPERDDVLVVGPIVLDRACRSVTVAGEPVALPRREFDIAEALMRSAGALVSRRQLLVDLWGGEARDSKSLDVQVGRLRARLAAIEGRRRILTVRGMGYRFLTDDDLGRIPLAGASLPGDVA